MKITPLILAALMISTSVFADVNPRNGNFAITFRELPIQQDGHELSIRRTFNSMATSKGWFGRGWGSRFETRLVAMPDNSIVVQDNGTGRKTSYFSDRFDLQAGVVKILTAASARKTLSPSATADLARKLMESDEARFRMVRDMELPVEVAHNRVFKTESCSEGSVTRTDDGFVRLTCEGARETFDTKGRLTSAVENDGYGFDIEYRDDLPHRIVDTNGKTVRLVWSPEGFLKGAVHNGKVARYEQDENGNLSTSKDERDNKYTYSYDEFHNLKKVAFIDTSTIEIEYNDAASGRANMVKDRLGNKTLYEYSVNPEDPLHFFTRVTKVPYDKAMDASVSEYEFRETIDDKGEQKVLSVAVASKEKGVNAMYDGKGRLKRKVDSNGNLLEIVYHPQTDRIIMVFGPRVSTEIRYTSDNVMDQIIVRTPKGHVTLNYGPNGKLIGMDSDSSKDPESIRAVAMALQNLVEIDAK